MADRNMTIITGGSRGIGQFLVQSLLEEMPVLNISRRRAEIGGTSRHQLHNLPADLQDVGRIDQLLRAWFDSNVGYRVKYLIHNAAALNLGALDKVCLSKIDQSFHVNVYAPLVITRSIFNLGRFAVPESKIVYVTSSLARTDPVLSFAGMGLYSVTKAALSRLALIQARELEIKAPHIKVIRIHPGIVDTEMQRELRRDVTLDMAFRKKTEGLPPYTEGDWYGKLPREHMRTISSSFAAEFILWAMRSSNMTSAEYDFYNTDEFHRARARS